MKTVQFWKLTGAGNDFAGFNNFDGKLPSDLWEKCVPQLCHRRFGIGADGVLIIESPPSGSKAHFKMRYFNADGSEAATCGNGARCIARLAHTLKVAPADMDFDTLAGPYHAVVRSGTVIVDLPSVGKPGKPVCVSCPEYSGQLDFLNVGVPHAVIAVEDIAELDVHKIGSALRHHPHFQPHGTNVNFVKVVDPHRIQIRTFERGVEAETLACGTGSLAASICLSAKGLTASPVSVVTWGGVELKFEFDLEPAKIAAIKMSGPAEIVFHGAIDLERLKRIYRPEPGSER